MRNLTKMPSDLFELIILAAITGFLIYKLYTILGQKVGFEPLSDIKAAAPATTSEPTTNTMSVSETSSLPVHIQNVIKEIQKIDAHFSAAAFLKGATRAFEIIIDSYAKHDLKVLRDLVAPDVFEEFKTSIDDREKQGETLETTLVKFESVELVEGEVNERRVHLTVAFQTEQIHLVRDAAGQIIDGHPQQIEQLVDTWVFERLISSRNPNWTLVKTIV